MELNPLLKFQLNIMKRRILVFYLVLVVIMIMMTGSLVLMVNSSNSMIEFGATELSSIIFLFIAGLNSFKDPFYMGIQNGVGRKTLFKTHLQEAMIISIIMSLIDQLLLIIGKIAHGELNSFDMNGIFEMSYPWYTAYHGAFLNVIANLSYKFCLYLLAVTIGYFITVAYYRMNKQLKIIVSVGLPITLFTIFPMFDEIIYQRGLVAVPISTRIGNLLLLLMGISSGNPLIGCVFLTFLTGVISLFCWMMIRKATIRNR